MRSRSGPGVRTPHRELGGRPNPYQTASRPGPHLTLAPPALSIPNHPPAIPWTLPGLPRRCSGSTSPLSTHPPLGTALCTQRASDDAHEWTGMCRGVFHSTRSSPSSYKSLFSPTKGKTLSGGQGVQGGPQLEVRRWLPWLPTARRAPVSRPGGVLTADSSPWTGPLRSTPAQPTQGTPR